MYVAAFMLNNLEGSGIGNVRVQIENCQNFWKCSGRWNPVK